MFCSFRLWWWWWCDSGRSATLFYGVYNLIYLSIHVQAYICSAEQHGSGNVFRSCQPLSLFCASKRFLLSLSFLFQSKLPLPWTERIALIIMYSSVSMIIDRSIGISLWNMNMCCILMYLCTCRSYIVKKFSLIKYDRLANDGWVKKRSDSERQMDADCCLPIVVHTWRLDFAFSISIRYASISLSLFFSLSLSHSLRGSGRDLHKEYHTLHQYTYTYVDLRSIFLAVRVFSSLVGV